MNDQSTTPTHYTELLTDIKQRNRTAQTRAMLSVNAELIRLYWELGQMLDARQQSEGWGQRSFRDWHKIFAMNCRR